MITIKVIRSVVFGLLIYVILMEFLKGIFNNFNDLNIFSLSISFISVFGFYFWDKIKKLLIDWGMTPKSENTSGTSLSYKYGFLKFVKGIIHLIIMFYVLYIIYLMGENLLPTNLMVTIIVTGLLSCCILYSLVLIINFIFELDKKTNK